MPNSHTATPVSASAGTSNDLVILVHGTKLSTKRHDDTSAPDDQGDHGAWWQPDRARDWLKAHLPPGTSVSDESFISFAWDGRNSQVSRLEAGNTLLALLLMLEQEGRRYHLVGHSHGGSVIREALISSEITKRQRMVDAELRRALNKPEILRGKQPIIPARWDEYAPWWIKHKSRYLPVPPEYRAIAPFIELRGLRSWTTVGTPFLHYLPARRPFVSGWPGRHFSLRRPRGSRLLLSELLDLLLVIVGTGPFILLAAMLISAYAGLDWGRSFLNSPVTNALLVPYAILWVGTFYVLGRRGFAGTLLVRERAAQRVVRRFGDRWLGLWSSSDEAINLLASLAPRGPDYEWVCAPDGARDERPDIKDIRGDLLPELTIPLPHVATHLLPDTFPGATRRIMKRIVWAMNRWLEPLWRKKIAATLVRTCQGSDLPAAVLAFVSPWPLPLRGAVSHPGLPPDTEARLERAAGQRTGQLRPALRQLLMAAALEGAPAAVAAFRDGHGSVAPNLFVHTSYFEDPDVTRLIAQHISATATGAVYHHDGTDDDTARWLAAHRDTVHAKLREFFARAS
jgi:hypothetical protein